MIHQLSIDEPWYLRVRASEKTAEVRVDDRDYQTGDILELRCYRYSERLRRRVTHCLRGVDGLAAGYVVLSLEDPRVVDLGKRARRAEREANRLTRELAARTPGGDRGE